MTDALDRACEAAWNTQKNLTSIADLVLAWPDLPPDRKEQIATIVAAALRVMADDLADALEHDAAVVANRSGTSAGRTTTTTAGSTTRTVRSCEPRRWRGSGSMSDALDRAAQAAFARWSDRLTWADLDETFGQAWRAQTAAALRVMADDLRALCDRQDWRGNGHMVYARDVLRILDTYTGSES